MRVVDTAKAATHTIGADCNSSSDESVEDKMPSQMVQRLIKRFEHYERETKGILECYDELEFNYDYL